MANFSLNVAKLPTHSELSTKHWEPERKAAFAAALQGIKSADWFQAGCAQLPQIEMERVALAFAYVAITANHEKNSQ